MAKDQINSLAVGERVVELLNLARAVVKPGCPETTVRLRLLEVDGLCVDVDIYSSVPGRPTLAQRIYRRLLRPQTWPSYAISVGGRVARRLGLRI
jgi:hypothetical protein